MYLSLHQVGVQSAETNGYIYPCLSVPINSSFAPYENEPIVQTKELYEPSFQYDSITYSYPSAYKPHPEPPISSFSDSPEPIPTYSPEPIPTESPEPIPTESPLLPVLDCRFNLREICKQSVLLEDHLTHPEKRCTDCCIKHFLALEGLCEEALTLDKKGDFVQKYTHLPNKIRRIQNLWIQDPHNNAHQCSQLLRELRKEFQPNVFSIIFSDSNTQEPLQRCSSGACKIKSFSK